MPGEHSCDEDFQLKKHFVKTQRYETTKQMHRNGQGESRIFLMMQKQKNKKELIESDADFG